MPWYIVGNDFDEATRLIEAENEAAAIAAAKASITTEAKELSRLRCIDAWQQVKATWEGIVKSDERHRQWCKEHNMSCTAPPLVSPYNGVNPEEFGDCDLDEYEWVIHQTLDLSQKVVVLEELYF